MAGKKGQQVKKSKEESKKFPEYYNKYFPELSWEECLEKAKNFRRSSNWQCIEYYEVNYPNLSHEEQELLRQEKLKNKKSNNPFYIEYYDKRYPNLSLEEKNKLMETHNRQENFQCIEYYKKRYPNLSNEEQEKLLNNAIKNYTSKRDESGEKNGMHHSKTTELQRRQISPRCIEFYERKYPNLSNEEHQKMLNDFFEKNKQIVKNAIKPTNIEYYLNQGLPLEEAKEALRKRQATFTLEKCIKKYGEEKGLEIFNNRQQKWIKSLYKSFNSNTVAQSKIAKDLFTKLSIYINKSYNDCTEKYMYDNINNKAYLYDFYYNNCLIEFNGDYWHANPNIYNKDKIFKRHNIEITAEEIWNNDNNKKIYAINAGYKLLIIWESDYRENPNKVIKSCINFLNENNN